MSQLSLFPTRESRPAGCSLFLAVFPDEHTAHNIYELGTKLRHKHGLSGRVRPLAHLHISLPCLKNLPDELSQVIQLADHACKTAAHATASFEVTFDRVSSFRGEELKRPLVLFGSADDNVELRAFHRLLAANFSARRSASPQFTPHLTLLYGREIIEEPIDPVSWKVNKIVLVQSHVGATKYDRLAQWKLCG